MSPIVQNTQFFQLNPLVIATQSPLPNATQGAAYSKQFSATGGTPPYTWAFVSGTLDLGLNFPASGNLNGTPVNGPETDVFTVKVTDSLMQSITGQFILTVAQSGGLPFPIKAFWTLDNTSPMVAAPTSVARYEYLTSVIYGGLEQSQGVTFNSLFGTIKAYGNSHYGRPTNCGIQQIDQEKLQTTSSPGATNSVQINTGNSQLGWRLQASGYPSGAFVPQETNYWVMNVCSSPSCPAYTINTVGTLTGANSPSGALGGPVTWSQFAGWWEVEWIINGQWAAMENGSSFSANVTAANPNLDRLHHDNWFMQTRSTGCWQSTATVFAAGSATISPALQAGEADWATAIRTMKPNIQVSANLDYYSYYNSGSQFLDSSNQNFWDFPMSEWPVGNKAPFVGSFTNFVNAMLSQEQAMKPGGNVIYLCEGATRAVPWQATQATIFSGTYGGLTPAQNYQALRYQIGLCAMLRHIFGIFSYSGDIWWADEFDAGAGSIGWLGQPLGARNFTPNAQGIIVLPFVGGTCYLYPAGNNDTTTGLNPVTINVSGHHIASTAGHSDPAINTGLAFNSLTISPRDCIFTLP